MSSIVSGFSGAASSYYEGRAQKSVYDRNADAKIYEMRANVDAINVEEEKILGSQSTAYAKSGVSTASGSPLVVESNTAKEEHLKFLRVNWAGTNDAWMQRWYGKVAKQAGTMGATTQAIGAGISLIGSIAGGVIGGMASGAGGAVSGAMEGYSGLGNNLSKYITSKQVK